LKRRTLPNPEASATSAIGIAVSATSRFAKSTLRLGDRDRRRADVPREEPPKVAAADPEPVGERLHVLVLVPRAVGDEREGAGDGVGGAAPARHAGRQLGPAAQAGAEAGRVRGRSAGEEDAVLGARRAGRANRAAEDPGREDGRVEAPVEARVAGAEGAVAGLAVQRGIGGRGRHAGIMAARPARC
jgi:hypothetical protein